MQQTTHATRPTQAQADVGPYADAGVYDYDLPVAQGGAQPLPAPHPAPRSAWKAAGVSVAEGVFFFFLTFGARFLHEWSGWRLINCYIIPCAAYTVLRYWSAPRPNQSFPRWALKVIGIWLNCYVAFVTVPESLRGLVPEPLAFGLPAFLMTVALYTLTPVTPVTGRRCQFRHWLVFAGCVALMWTLGGPYIIE